MKLLKILWIPLVLGSVLVLIPGCGEQEPAPAQQRIPVTRGDLTVDITGVGNLALSNKEDLAFEMDGTVAEVLVEEADSVEEGQVLARLDTSAWEDQLTALEDKVTSAERTVTSKLRAVTAAERNVTTAEQNVVEKERAVTDAERAVTTARYNLIQAKINLNNAKLSLEQTEETSTDPLEIEAKQLALQIAEGKVSDAEQAVEDAATLGIADAHQAVDDAGVKLEDARIAVEDAGIAVEDARKALENAQKALDDAKSASPEIKAPFAGFITSVNVVGGDEIKKGTVAVTLADPSKFEADISVSELDILQITVGSQARVTTDAIADVVYPAEVTHISPTATISQGVVNYKVKVTLRSIEMAASGNVTRSRGPATANITGGEVPGPLQQAIAEGRITREQVETMMQRFGQGQGGLQQGQVTGVEPENMQLREGLTVTVSIIVEQRNEVLLVPNSAITTQGRQTFVQVPAADGATEQRSVQTGISDFQYTEITGGLTEGEEIVIIQGASSTATNAQGQRQQGGMFIPGGARMR